MHQSLMGITHHDFVETFVNESFYYSYRKLKKKVEQNDISCTHFVHIGKCGGTHIENLISFDETTHLTLKPIRDDALVVAFIRNPFDRFISAFNYVSAIVRAYQSGGTWLKHAEKLNYGIVKRKRELGFFYHPEYDKMVLMFSDANDLAEK